eukprot:5455585-Pleurochrysis_carterae.AAC.1
MPRTLRKVALIGAPFSRYEIFLALVALIGAPALAIISNGKSSAGSEIAPDPNDAAHRAEEETAKN